MKFRHVVILSLSLMMLLCSLTATACEYCWFWHYPGYFPTEPTEATSPTDPTEPTEATTDYERIVTDNSVVFITDSGIVEVPVTDLWVKQNEKLEELMKVYNENFNN